jgi:N-acetylglucosaminyldiphosphoundecaprenol N-acetyl-beta-D-mannosaminyltransferase
LAQQTQNYLFTDLWSFEKLLINPTRVEILGVPVDCVTMEQAVHWVEAMLASTQPKNVIAVNPEKVIKANQDPELLKRLQQGGLLIPDGIGVVFAVRLLGLGNLERVPGSELMPRLCERAAKKGYRVFLFGASEEVVSQAALVLRERYPGLNIVGTQHGYVNEEEMPSVITAINDAQADLLFVALGSPKQELWMTRYLPSLKVKVCQGVGGTFDVIAGRVKRAPLVFRVLHLEWFYRLLSQPTRILRQSALPLFAFRVLRKRVLGS